MSWKDDVRRTAKEAKEGNKFKLLEGENTFRLLPAKEGAEYPPYVITRSHYKLGPNQDTPVRCGKNADGEGECWLCDRRIPELQKSDSKAKRAQAAALASKKALTVQVSAFDPETSKFSPPKPWTMDIGGPKAASTIVLSLLSSTKRSYEDPLKGYNITLERTGVQLKTTYGVPTPDDKPSKVPNSILVQIKAFDELLRPYDEEDQKAAYFGRPRKDADVEEEDAASGEESGAYEDAGEDIPEEPIGEEEDHDQQDEEYEPNPEEEEPEPEEEEPEPGEDGEEEEPESKPMPKRRLPPPPPKRVTKPEPKATAQAPKKAAPPPPKRTATPPPKGRR